MLNKIVILIQKAFLIQIIEINHTRSENLKEKGNNSAVNHKIELTWITGEGTSSYDLGDT